MAGGGRGQRKPANSSSSSSAWQWKPRGSREFGHESSLDSQKEGSCSSSPSVSSKKSPPQMVTPVQPPESLESPPQIVTPVEPPKSLDSQLQMVTPVQAPKSQDSTGKSSDGSRNGRARAPCFSASETEPMAGGDGRKLVTSSWQRKSHGSREFVRSSESQMKGSYSSSPSVSSKKSPLQPPKSLDSPLQMVESVQPPQCLEPLIQTVASVELSKSLDSLSVSCGSGTVGSYLGAAPFDICKVKSNCPVKLNPPLFTINRANRLARDPSSSISPFQHLGPGMVLLKNFLKQADQVKIIKLCRDLGVGPGGFYQPGYEDGAKLSLRMMCLGKNWDPSSSYGDVRHFDGARPPKIPVELTKLVKAAILQSHEFLKGSTCDPSSELPLMSPDICVVNFYTSTGKLGLHQDKDETEGSRAKGLPVVSFSLGDTAEFLYGNSRDEAKASKINLQSGDVLIFGGESRHIFHGVSSIAPKTAPDWVTNEGNLRAGRLNLTFRQY